MQNELQVFKNEELSIALRAVKNSDGSISINLEDAARGLGFTQTKNNKEYVRWETVKVYLEEYGVSQQVGKDTMIPESVFYLLAMKASNDAAKRFQIWVASEVLPSVRKTGAYNIEGSRLTLKERDLAIREKNAKVRLARAWQDLADRSGDNKEYQQICSSYASAALNDGQPVLPLPESKEKYYSATEVGKRLGISSNKVGRIAKMHNLKIEKNGKWFFDKSQSSNKQVSNFMYNENGIEAIKSAMEEGVQ